MKVLVTGAAGFIGSNLVAALSARGYDVIAIDDLSAGYQENLEGINCEFHRKDVTHADRWGKLLKNIDVVFHQAASKKNICERDPVRDLNVNGGGTLKLLQQCVKYGVRKFVHASTGSVYGERQTIIREDSPLEPVSYYGVSKLAGERYVQMYHRTYGLDTTILRYFHVFGPKQECHPKYGGVLAIFANRIRKGLPITIHGDGKQERVFTYVADIVRINIEAAQNAKAKGKIYNCCGDNQVNIIDAAMMIAQYFGKHPFFTYSPNLTGDIRHFEVDNNKSKNDMSIKYKSFNDALNEYLSLFN